MFHLSVRLKICLGVILKFIYSEKAARFCEIFPLLLTTVHRVKSKVEDFTKFCALLRIYKIYKTEKTLSWRMLKKVPYQICASSRIFMGLTEFSFLTHVWPKFGSKIILSFWIIFLFLFSIKIAIINWSTFQNNLRVGILHIF